MTIENNTKITDSEWEVMRVVWANGNVTSNEIIEILQQKKDWKPATTKTFIGRLVNKGMLDTKSKGRGYLYSPKVGESEIISSNLKEFFNNICNKNKGSIIAEIISKTTLSFKDIEMIEEVLEMKKKNAVDEVPCNCIPGQCHCNIHQHPQH